MLNGVYAALCALSVNFNYIVSKDVLFLKDLAPRTNERKIIQKNLRWGIKISDYNLKKKGFCQL